MLKKLTIMMLGVGAVFAASAAPLTPNQALSRLSGSSSLKSVKKVAVNPVLKYSFADNKGKAVAYAFEPANGSGFMILSADDIAYPVLGYSDNGKFDTENMPEQLKGWIEGYGEEIEYAKSMGITPEVGNIMLAPRGAREAILPLVKSKWDQGSPYNNECPTVNGIRCVTGCVATSVAQVMNYFKYPEIGTGTVRATLKPSGQSVTMDLAERAFEWNNMLDNYVDGTYNDAQASAVAYLMKAAGYSVNMSYGTDASGAVSMVIAKALRDNFKYDPGITFEGRVSYSASDWDEKVYNNIKNGSPVIYNGNDSEVGHSFICDGYNGNGYYHINWGWSGMSDGYFLLNALNPEALGTGGGEGGGFNFRQGGVFNICKPGAGWGASNSGEPTLTAYGLLGVSSVTQDAIGRSVINIGLLEGYGTMTGWMNESSESMRLSVGGIFKNAETGAVVMEQSGKLGTSYTISPSAGSYYLSSLKLSVTVPDNLPDGDYKLVAATKNENSSSAPWVAMKVPYSYPDYVLVSKHNGKVTASSVAPPQLQISNMEVVGNVYYGRRVTLKFMVKNPSEYEITDAMSLELLEQGKCKFKSANMLVTVPANSEIEQEWTVLMYPQNGQGTVTTETTYDISIVNDLNHKSYGTFGQLSMRANPGDPSVSMRSMTVDGAGTESVMIGNTKFTAYVVDSPDFTVNLTFRVTKGYFDYKVYADVMQQAPEATSPSQMIPYLDNIFSQQVELSAGEEITLNIPVKMGDANRDEIYYVKCKYYGPKSERSIGQYRFKIAGGSAVEEIDADANGEAEYYNMLGIRVANPQSGEMVIERRNGKATKKIFK